MQYRFLGHSGLKVSAVAFGNCFNRYDAEEAEKVVEFTRTALDVGITTFDTADMYGNGRAEIALGKALAGVRRESLEVATKVFWPLTDPGPDGWGGPNDKGLSRKHILESIDGSLARLGMDYVDLYQAHRYDYATPLEETMQAFADIVRAGKALYIGVSEWTPDQLRAGHALAAELRVPFVSNQPQYNMIHRVIEPEVVPASAELGISQICYSPLYEGVLTGKYTPGQDAPAGSRAQVEGLNRWVTTKLADQTLLQRVQQLAPVAADEGLTMAQLAIAWLLAQPTVASAIIGASRPEQIRDSAAAAGHTLTPDTLARIDQVLADSIDRDPAEIYQKSPKERPL